jgi:hypothetical protein
MTVRVFQADQPPNINNPSHINARISHSLALKVNFFIYVPIDIILVLLDLRREAPYIAFIVIGRSACILNEIRYF